MVRCASDPKPLRTPRALGKGFADVTEDAMNGLTMALCQLLLVAHELFALYGSLQFGAERAGQLLTFAAVGVDPLLVAVHARSHIGGLLRPLAELLLVA